MKFSKPTYLLIITILLCIYYLVCALYLYHMGYYSQETLFYVEKAKIVFEGLGDRLKVMGLTSPIFPFYATFIFTAISYNLAPIMASAIGSALLFNIMANILMKRINDDFYLFLLLVVFLLHPGIIYMAASGKSMYLQMIFFFLFYVNIFKFYDSNTTFHVSIASICLVILVFCNYKFIWLTLFFIPLVLSISIQSLNLSEKESVFRLFSSFNNPSLRRKLINKTFALYIIIFILPLISVLIYKMLNLTHANDLNYFIDSPYATWSVLSEKLDYNVLLDTGTHHKLPEVSIVTSLRIVLFCPLIIIAMYLFSNRTYQVLTLFTPFAFVEFLRIKYDKVYLAHQYYLMFLVLALLCVIFKSSTIKNQRTYKIVLSVVMAVQLFTGWIYLDKSYVLDDQTFIHVLLKKEVVTAQESNMDLANYINSLPDKSHVIMDDAVAYPIGAFIDNVQCLILPYQNTFISAIETPAKYADYILVASDKNPTNDYTQLTSKYLQILRNADNRIYMEKKYETDSWILYKIEEH